MDHMMGRTERVWITEWENHRKSGKIVVGHTSNYSKVVIPFEEDLVGKEVIFKITKCLTWHVEGEIVDRNPEQVTAPEGIFHGIEEMYARKKAEKDAMLAKRKLERRARLKAMRKKAQEAERKKIEARKAAEAEKAGETAVDSEITENRPTSTNVTAPRASTETVKPDDSTDFTFLYLGIGLVLLGIVLKTLNF
jgi:hypothetical protein